MITKKLQDFIDEPRKNYESDKTDSQDKIYVTQDYIVRTKRRLKIHNISNENETTTKKD